MSIPDEKIDDLLKSISNLVLSKLKAEAAPPAEDKVSVKNPIPYAVIEVHHVYNKESAKCPVFEKNEDDVPNATASAFEAMLEFLITVGLFIWIIWILSNLPIFMF
jgi:hypothetical protein